MNNQSGVMDISPTKHLLVNLNTKGKVTINHESIKNELSAYAGKPDKAIIEYIWNGFDSGANRVDVNYSFSKTVDDSGFGYPNLEIIDDGIGWDFDQKDTMKIFLDSKKILERTKSLPHGNKGVGRFTFHVFADQALWETVYLDKQFAFQITSESLDKYQSVGIELSIQKGTKVSFRVSSEILSQCFFDDILVESIKEEFAWLLKLYPNKRIFINNKLIEFDDLIERQKKETITIDKYEFDLEYIQWVQKLSGESSKYYFLNSSGDEVSKTTTGLNYKSDVFHHSVYIKSNFFDNYCPLKKEKADNNQLSLDKNDKDNKKIFSDLSKKIKEVLVGVRKEYLVGYSETLMQTWEKDKILPDAQDLTISEEEYRDVIKEVYIAVPQLFTNAGEDQRKIILRLLGSLMGTDERDYILTIIEQVYGLSPEDKSALMDLLSRTNLSNMIRTIKEVDHRIQVLDSLEELLFDPSRRKTTKEVKHLQKFLDDNFWVFGDEFALFSSTEGQIKKTLERFKNEVLHKEDDVINTESRKELDLLLSKYDSIGKKHVGVVVEIKRPSKKLGKKEYDQMEGYMRTIIAEPACNGDGMEWYFYLVGNDYDDYVSDKIRNANLGEQDKGLIYRDNAKNVKYYIRKWSDIINVDQKSRYKFLKDKLQASPQSFDDKTSAEITHDILEAHKDTIVKEII